MAPKARVPERNIPSLCAQNVPKTGVLSATACPATACTEVICLCWDVQAVSGKEARNAQCSQVVAVSCFLAALCAAAEDKASARKIVLPGLR